MASETMPQRRERDNLANETTTRTIGDRIVPAMRRPSRTIVNLTSPEAVRSWLRDTMRELDLSVAEWARISSVGKATIWRALSGQPDFMMSSKTIQKLSAPILERIGSQQLFDPFSRGEEPLYISRDLTPKIWQEYKADPNNPPLDEKSDLYVIPYIEDDLQWLGRVKGDYFAPFYLDGDLVHVVETRKDDGRHYKENDHVVVARIREAENIIQLTLWVVKGRRGSTYFLDKPYNAQHDLSLSVEHDGAIVNGTETRILGLAVASHRFRNVGHRLREVDYRSFD